MPNDIKEKLRKIASDTAKKIRGKTHISGWHEDETQFPKSDYDDVVEMLETACHLGAHDAMSKFSLVQFDECIGPYKLSKVAVFNKNQIQAEDVLEIIKNGLADNHPDILVVDESKWVRIFRDGKPLD